MKMRNCLLSLVLIGTSMGLAALPARAESKLSQCKRFGQTMDTFVKQVMPPLQETMQAKTAEVYISSLDKALNASKQGLKQVENRRFSDRRLQTLQTQTVNMYIDMHNTLVGVANAFDNRDRKRMIAAANQLKPLITREQKMIQQFNAYCRQP